MGVACRNVCATAGAPRPAAPIYQALHRHAALEPIDHVAGVRFEQEFELGAQAGDALAQAGGFVDAGEPLHLGFETAEGGADGHVEVAGGFEELFAAVEGLAAVAGHGQPAKNMRARSRSCWRERRADCVGALFAAQQGFGVAGQLFKAHVADREAEVAGGDLFELVGLVEDHGGGLGEDAGIGRAGGLLPDGEVGEEEVVVDDDDVRFQGLAAHLGDEAALVVGAGGAEAGFGCGRRACARAALDSGRPEISARSPVSVVFSHSAICWYWSISSRPDRMGWVRRATSLWRQR